MTSWIPATNRRSTLSDSQVAAAHGGVHNPALLHHFAEAQQQRDAASLGMWVFLGTEIMFFGGLFCTYLVYRRWYFGDWGAASKTLDVTLGATNTAVLICSSLTVVLAVWAAQTCRRKLLIGNLLATLILGMAFLGIKGIEYKEKFEKHHVPGASFQFQEKIPGHPDQYANPQHAQIFFALYFVMTGLHAVHMIVGLGIFVWLLVAALKGRFSPDYK